MINYPDSPTVGQQFTAAGITWIWDGVKWTAAGSTTALAQAIGDNRIINGDMRIDQRNNGASGTAIGVYTADRWFFQANQASKFGWQRFLAGASLNAVGFGYYLSFSSQSVYTALAADVFVCWQPIEADMTTDFAWGTSGAQPVTLSFIFASSLTGTLGGSIKNAAGNRSYPFTFSNPVASVWTKIVITIPGDTAGTWVMSGNGAALYLVFDLGCGVNTRGPANAWALANYNGATGSANIVGTNAAVFQLTGVKLEIGNVATPFNRYSLAKSMADCQRYYQSAIVFYGGYSTAGGNINSTIYLPVIMRASPTLIVTGGSGSNTNAGTPVFTGNPNGIQTYCAAVATGAMTVNTSISLNAEL